MADILPSAIFDICHFSSHFNFKEEHKICREKRKTIEMKENAAKGVSKQNMGRKEDGKKEKF